MGIQGLLPLLRSVTTPVHIREYAGKVVAVDTYSWLHKGAFTCSKELCEGLPTTKYVDYCMHRVDLLRQHGIKPLMVFDGGLLPMKEEQENTRARTRKFNLERAREHELSGNHAAAYQSYQKAVDITPQIAFQLVKVLQQEQISYIVAPYEADAQMAFLALNGHVDVVITEDSDLIPFGCSKVMFKMDKFGQGVEFQNDDLAKNTDLNFTSFTKQMFLEMCILSGCDYLPSLQGMGMKKAHVLIKRFRNYQKVLKHLRFSGVCVPSNYEETFAKAILTFQHQRVYDPVLQDIVHLTQLPLDLTLDLEFLGPALSQKLGQAIARGEIDPLTGKGFELAVLQDQPILKSAPSKAGSSNGLLKRHFELPVQKNLLTNYFVSVSKEAKRQFKAPRSKVFSENVCGMLSLEEDHFQTVHSIEPSGNSLDLGAATDVRQHPPNLDFTISIEEEDEVLTFLNSEMAPMASVDLSHTSSGGHELTNSSIRRKSFLHKTRGNCVVQSAYFLKRNKAQKSSTSPDTGSCMGKGNTSESLSERHSCPEERDHSEGNKLIGCVFEDLERISPQQPQLTGDEPKTMASCHGSRIKHGGKCTDFISAGEKKHVPAFSSKLVGVSVQPVKFASDTSHIEQYASIAQKSMDRFVAAIAPFCLSSTGARASGLRRPLKSSSTETAGRNNKSAEDLNKFAYARPSCRLSPNRGKSVRTMTCATRCKDSFLADWD